MMMQMITEQHQKDEGLSAKYRSSAIRRQSNMQLDSTS